MLDNRFQIVFLALEVDLFCHEERIFNFSCWSKSF